MLSNTLEPTAHSSIRRKLLTSIVAYSAIVALCASALHLFFDYRSEMAIIESRLDQIGESYSDSLAKAIWHMDRDAVELQLQGIRRFPDIERVSVIETHTQAAPAKPLLVFWYDPANLLREIPLAYVQHGETYPLGTLLIEVNMRSVYYRILTRVLLILGTQSLTIFLVAACIFLVVQHLVTRHLVAIASHVRGVDVGNLGQELSLDRTESSTDEISEVATALNFMSGSLRDSLAALNESRKHVDALNRDLEVRIEERTQELQDTVSGLQVSERRFRDIAENTGDWIWEADAQGRLVYSSDVAERVLGFRSGDTIGRSILDILVGGSGEDASRVLRDALAHGKRLRGFTAETLNRQAERVATETALVPVYDTDQGVSGYRGVTRDISERTKAERALAEAHRQTVELSRAAGKAEVATGVLHNMGNTLNGVTVSVSLMKGNALGMLVADLKRAVEMIREHEEDLGAFVSDDPRGRHLVPFLSEVTSQLATAQQFIDGELQSSVEKLDHMQHVLSAHQRYARVKPCSELASAADLFEDALRINGDPLARHQIKILREYDPQGTELRVDKHRVLEILTNLLLNAKDALVACEAREDKCITLRTSRDGEFIRLAVFDNGLGIHETDLVRIFTYGFTTKASGNGFGLHSCANSARELGGDLQVRSDGPGRGAEFCLILPAQPSA